MAAGRGVRRVGGGWWAGKEGNFNERAILLWPIADFQIGQTAIEDRLKIWHWEWLMPLVDADEVLMDEKEQPKVKNQESKNGTASRKRVFAIKFWRIAAFYDTDSYRAQGCWKSACGVEAYMDLSLCAAKCNTNDHCDCMTTY